MKASKVEHRRTAVSSQAKGILYEDPAKGSEDIGVRIKERRKEAGGLYNILNQASGKNETVKSICKSFSQWFTNERKKLKLDNDGNRQIGVDFFKTLKADNKLRDVKEGDIDTVINKYLRVSLLSYKDTIKDLVRVRCGLKEIKDIKENSLVLLAEYITHDINKSEWMVDYTNSDGSTIEKIRNKGKSYKSIISSIENQNMVVQPCSSDESGDSELIFALATNNGNIRGKEKKAFNDFLKHYAVLEAEVREDLLKKLRRIVVLYFYGDTEVKKGDESYNIWADHENRKNNLNEFVTVPDELKEKSASSDSESEENKRRRKILEDLKTRIRRKNIERYRESLEIIKNDKERLFFDDFELNKCFVHYIENFVEKRFENIRCSKLYMLETGNVSEKAWKALLSYLTVNYIAIGKAVYNFSMSDISKTEGTMNLGVVEDKWKTGISSFEYEKIKAEETLQRDIAVYVSFAVNNLSKATIKPEKGKEDILLLGDEELKSVLLSSLSGLTEEDALLRNIMMYFGGISIWKEFFENRFNNKYSKFDFYKDIIHILYAVRNESFHFTTANVIEDKWNTKLISDIFNNECDSISRVQKDKFYSNNLHKFYSEDKLKKVLNFLYDEYTIRPSQIPAFNKVFVKNDFSAYLDANFVTSYSWSDSEKKEWETGLYFLFKEVYYNRFLRDITVEKFCEAVKQLDILGEKQKFAHKNFNSRLEKLKKEGFSLSEICQILTVEKNLQNKNRKVKTSKSEKENPDIFRHYTEILESGLRQAFTSYVNEKLSFLNETKRNSNVDSGEVFKTEFLKDWKGKKYDSLKAKISQETKYQKWYILGKFLNPKQLNLLNGAVKHYIQYSKDVERRAKQTGNPLSADSSSHRKECEIISEILDMDMQLIGKVFRDNYNEENNSLSPDDVILDYFDSTDEYAKYVSLFVDYGYETNKDEDATSHIGYLQAFCNTNTEVLNGQKIGIYYDAEKPIPNRNIIISKLFGLPIYNDKFQVLSRINEDEIKEYYNKKENLGGYKKTGKCHDLEEQEQLKEFQELKNRIELYNIVDYSELINELLGQLVNWVYIRERDLMYFQLGFHYLCLKSNCEFPEQYKTITIGNQGTINGAILYQLVATNTNGLPVYTLDNDGCDVDAYKYANKSTGAKISKCFLKYSEKIGYSKENNIYDAGLELFQDMSEENNINEFRDYIDHFKYFVDKERSILELYSEMFDRFMAYDQKYRKNVPNMLSNILKRNYIITHLEFKSGQKKVGRGNKSTTKEMGIICIRDNGIESEDFTYKLADKSTVELPARGTNYLDEVAKLLYSPKSPSKVVNPKMGEKYQGVVKNINKHGIFVDFGAKKEGLVRYRNIPMKYKHASTIVGLDKGDTIDVKLLDINEKGFDLKILEDGEVEFEKYKSEKINNTMGSVFKGIDLSFLPKQ